MADKLASAQVVHIVPWGIHQGANSALGSECAQKQLEEAFATIAPVRGILDLYKSPNWEVAIASRANRESSADPFNLDQSLAEFVSAATIAAEATLEARP